MGKRKNRLGVRRSVAKITRWAKTKSGEEIPLEAELDCGHSTLNPTARRPKCSWCDP